MNLNWSHIAAHLHPKSLIFRRAFATGFTVLLGAFLMRYFPFTQGLFLIVTAVLVVQAPLGSFVRQGLKRFLIIMICVAIISLLMLTPVELIYMRAYEVIVGATLGLAVGVIFLPAQIDEEFRARITQMLTAYEEYFVAIINLMYRKENAEKIVQEKKYLVEEKLQTLPDWVYEAGFSPSLRQGYRHFLVRTEQLGQILFAMHRVARYSFDPALLIELQESLFRCVEQVKNVLNALIMVLNLKPLTQGVDDFAEDVAALDKVFQEVFPAPSELTEMSTDYLYAAEFICDLKDFRQMLLRLAEALR